jgi:hypothetical protein
MLSYLSAVKLLHLYSRSFSLTFHSWREVNSSVIPTLNASHFHSIYPAVLPFKDTGYWFWKAQETFV